MKKALLLIAAAMFVLAGCQKEQAEQEAKSNNVIHIGVKQLNSPVTRVVADTDDLANTTVGNEVKFYWEEGDEVGFYCADSFSPTPDAIYSCTNPDTEAFTLKSGSLDPNKKYQVFTPSSGLMSLFLGLTHHYIADKIPSEHIIYNMSVNGDATDFTLDHHSSLLHFKLKGNAIIGSIEYVPDNDFSCTLVCENGVQLNNDIATDFYLDIAARCSAYGFKLVFKNTEGKQIFEQTSTFDLSDYFTNYIIDFADEITVNVD